MNISYSSGAKSAKHIVSLTDYCERIRSVIDTRDFTKPESSLATFADELMRSGVDRVTEGFSDVTDLVLIGIGGSSLGTEAIHSALKNVDSPNLHVLDAVSDTAMTETLTALKDVPLAKLVITIISKSGGTTETLANAEYLLESLVEKHGEEIYKRVIAIGNEGNHLLTAAASKGARILPMHEHIGGRYSVFTSVGLVPLKLLGYDVDALLSGLTASVSEESSEMASLGASSLLNALESGVTNVNYFTFDTRLTKLGFWYRQLVAESIGKEFDRDNELMELGFIPTISTPVELHSIGQLYFSGFKGVFTDFVSVADLPVSHHLSKEPIFATQLSGKSLSEIASAIEGGVIKAYDERQLSFRKTELPNVSEKSLGQFMGQRMFETMLLAELLNVNAFDQPNVELYKDKTREILNG